MDLHGAKHAARTLRHDLAARGVEITHSEALELLARQLGHRDWNTAAARLEAGTPAGLGCPVPVLRVQDGDAARDFYTERLGFTFLREHRLAPELPLYLRIARDAATLDLSEHYGDGTPGSVVWIPVRDIRALHAELTPRLRPRQHPAVEDDAPGGPTMDVLDPFGNSLRFCQTQ